MKHATSMIAIAAIAVTGIAQAGGVTSLSFSYGQTRTQGQTYSECGSQESVSFGISMGGRAVQPVYQPAPVVIYPPAPVVYVQPHPIVVMPPSKVVVAHQVGMAHRIAACNIGKAHVAAAHRVGIAHAAAAHQIGKAHLAATHRCW